MNLTNDREQLAVLRRKYQMRMLAPFGSVLTGRFEPESNVDILFKYDPALEASLFNVAEMKEALGITNVHMDCLASSQ